MSDRENRRKCFKCGSSPAEDHIKLFRFPNPGARNLIRCELWAKYVFPDKQDNDIQLQRKLYSEHRMLCQKHFKDEDFTDSSKNRLLRTAIPCDTQHEMLYQIHEMPYQIGDQAGPSGDQAGPSQQRLPFRDITNRTEPLYAQPSSSRELENMADKDKNIRLKCTKYLKKICQLQNRIKHLKAKPMLNAIIEDKSVKKLSGKITPAFALLLQGQIRNFNRKSKGRRWSKEEKITALRIFKRSPTCYRLLRRLFNLPSPSTLKTFLNKVPFDVGVNQPVFNVLKKFVKTLEQSDNEFVLMFDEMSLKKHLSYNSKNDLIEGFRDHGSQGRTEQIAGYALVFMIGGIRKRIKQPLAHFFSSGFSTADRLAVLIKEVLHQCFEAGVNIAATVCDMDGVNRRALSILGASAEHPSITVQNKEIVTLYDTPHLLKCFRVAKWSHIKDFFEMDNKNPNFVFAPVLKRDHLNPNTKQKMKVNIAAQVLSHSVAAGMFAKISDGTLTAESTVTANVIANMDKLFDLVNSDSSDLRRGKPHSTNMTATSPHIKLFAQMKDFFATMKYVGSPRRPPSQDGWIWTLNGIERLWRNLVQRHGIKAMSTRRLQQDPLENLFGCIRGNCGSNTNPTCGQFLAGLKTAILSNLSHMGTTGNCEEDNNVIINNFDTLLSTSKPKQSQNFMTENEPSFNVSLAPPFDAEEAFNENVSEIQACAYVSGFLLKLLPIKDCNDCRQIFLSSSIENYHLFVECREYSDLKKSLNYTTKEMIACVESCSIVINNFLKEKSFIKLLKQTIVESVKTIVDFDFLNTCVIHRENNINIILNSVFVICTKRFCILKNRALSEEASACALKRKMNIILHK